MPSLVPRSKLSFKVPGATGDACYFDPVIVEQRGVLVAGGPSAVSVFLIGDRSRLWYTIAARVCIYGFSATPGALYVQDGPVLSGWNLTEHRCFAAVNLVTEERWAPVDDDDETEPPESLYDLPAEAARLQGELLTARSRHIAAAAPGNRIATPESVWLKDLPGAAMLVFSAPAVREIQFDAGSGRIFSLCMDGVTIALTDQLEVANKLANESLPLRAELAMAEVRQGGGEVLCYLYYVAGDGSISALDGTTDLRRQPTRWASKGAPVPGRVLPLRSCDGLLFGGGILGADFFVLELNPLLPPRCTMHGAWKSYDIAVPEKLALVSDGTVTRLICYDKDARQRDRWRERRAPATCHGIFWTGTGERSDPPSARLTIETDLSPATENADLGFRVLLANPIDSEAPELTSQYPPPVTLLDTSSLAGSASTVPRPGTLLARPVVAQHALYCVVRTMDAGAVKDRVLVYSIAPIASSVAAAAAAQLEKNRLAAKPIVLQVNWVFEKRGIGGSERSQPSPFSDHDVLIIVNDKAASRVEERRLRTDGRGQIRLDSSMAGIEAGPSGNNRLSERFNAGTIEMTMATLTSAQLNVVQFTWWEYHGKA